jgi:[protein-PII] uridylyltransferase
MSERGGTAVFVHTQHDTTAFGRATAALDHLGLTVMDARLVPDEGDRSLATYTVLEADGAPISDRHRVDEIQRVMVAAMRRRDAASGHTIRRMPRKVRAFRTPTQVTFAADERNDRTAVEIVTADRPGLLAGIGKVFATCEVRVQTAKVTTVGERVEDVFFVTDEDGQPLDDDARAALDEALQGALNTD